MLMNTNGTLIAHANCTQTLLGIVCNRCHCFYVFVCIFAVSVPPLVKLLMEINPQMLRSALLFGKKMHKRMTLYSNVV